MKNFLTYTLATILGIFIVNVIFLFIFLGFIGAMASMGDKQVNVADNSILEIKLDGIITDRASTNPMDNFDFLSMSKIPSLGLNKILESIEKASRDERIRGIYMELQEVTGDFGGFGALEEIRKALVEFKKSGKFIYSYSNMGYSQKGYYLASVSDSIFVNPETPLILNGIASNITFYKKLLDNVGIKTEIVKVGKYKSAVEPFTETQISDANRLQIESYINSIWGSLLKEISESRKISVDKLNAYADNFDIRDTKEDVRNGFFDKVVYKDEMIDILKAKCGLKQNETLPYTPITDYQYAVVPNKTNESGKDKIAVIYATGGIGFAQTSSEIGPELADEIRNVRKDKNIKAIVLRVNSPGGSALTSDIIWREVKLAAQEKPLIVSMGNVAASGGYYISCAADMIIADPMTLTGSIGIYGQLFTGEKLIKETIGLTSSTVKTNKYSDFGGVYPLPLPVSNRPLSAYEKEVLQRNIEKGYETFLSRVGEGRGMSRDEVHELAQGRVWTGKDALKVGLVDALGGLEDAIRIAAERAELTNYRIAEYPQEQDFFSSLLSNFSASVKTNIVKEELGAYYPFYENLKRIMNTQQGVVAGLPYALEIY